MRSASFNAARAALSTKSLPKQSTAIYARNRAGRPVLILGAPRTADEFMIEVVRRVHGARAVKGKSIDEIRDIYKWYRTGSDLYNRTNQQLIDEIAARQGTAPRKITKIQLARVVAALRERDQTEQSRNAFRNVMTSMSRFFNPQESPDQNLVLPRFQSAAIARVAQMEADTIARERQRRSREIITKVNAAYDAVNQIINQIETQAAGAINKYGDLGNVDFDALLAPILGVDNHDPAILAALFKQLYFGSVSHSNRRILIKLIGFTQTEGSVANPIARFIPLNSAAMSELDDVIMQVQDVDTAGSGAAAVLMYMTILRIEIIFGNRYSGLVSASVGAGIAHSTKSGGFFKHFHKLPIDLDRFGIYAKWNTEALSNNCLIHAFQHHPVVGKMDLTPVKLMCKVNYIPMKALEPIAEAMKIQIKLRVVRNCTDHTNHTTRQVMKGNSGPIVELGLYDEHYFLIEPVSVTSYAIEHYDEIKHLDRWNEIIEMKKTTGKPKPNRSQKRFIDSFRLVELLIKNKDKLLTPIEYSEDVMKSLFYNKIDISSDFDIVGSINEHTVTNKRCRYPAAWDAPDFREVPWKANFDHRVTYMQKCIDDPTIDNRDAEKFREAFSTCSGSAKRLQLIHEMGKGKYLGFHYGQQIRLPQKISRVAFFDIETTTDGLRHTPYLCSASYGDCTSGEEGKSCLMPNRWIVKSWIGSNCVRDAVAHLAHTNCMFIIHNAGYDFRLMVNEFDEIKSIFKDGTRIKQAMANYKRSDGEITTCMIKDSLSIIPMPLAEFGKSFGIPVEKEVLPYDAYTEASVKLESIPIDLAMKSLKKDHPKFLENIREWGLQRGEEFDHINYSRRYCEMDCEVLRQGYLTFRDWIFSSLAINIDKVISVPQIADKFLSMYGCYNDVKELSGIPRVFIQKTVRGGRVMCNDNSKQYFKSERSDYSDALDDFDAVSLYPSAMIRIAETEQGFCGGAPHVLDEKEIDEINEQISAQFYFVRIKIKSIGKRRQFPIISFKDRRGLIQYCDDIEIVKDIEFYVDRITLEDWIQFQRITFVATKGYGFAGVTRGIGEAMKFMFHERLIKKKEKNPIQLVYKLIMNSGYGRTIMKPIEKKTTLCHGVEACNAYVQKNYEQIISYDHIYGDGADDEKYFAVDKKVSIDKHRSMPHIGSVILSMSKRIMNEVMCLAEDLGLKIFYQDTDSMHIRRCDVKILSVAYQKKYDRELIGEQPGQFHSDFSFPSKDTPAHAVESYFVGKKCYIDQVRCVNDGVESFHHHIRMKGVSENAIWHAAKEQHAGDPMAIYRDLFNGKRITFDLLAAGAVKFQVHKDFSISNRSKFTRTLQFGVETTEAPQSDLSSDTSSEHEANHEKSDAA